jgi:hypothetical protein
MTTERPILFSAPMVRALLAGTKTQTRRAIKPQPYPSEYTCQQTCGQGSHLSAFRGTPGWAWDGGTKRRPAEFAWAADEPCAIETTHCPYGKPGDRLWVRETWGVMFPQYIADTEHEPTFWRADYSASDERDCALPRWRSSIHMPRARSRITLEITDVRVQRLQDISFRDVVAEGCAPLTKPEVSIEHDVDAEARACFGELWDSINGAGSWDANPWVWVLTFKVSQR